MGRRRRAPRSRTPAVDGPPAVAGHRVVGPVGFGSDGAVWAARDPTGREVVVSVLALSAGSPTVRRLAAIRQGTHPHLARIRQVVTLDDARCAVVSDRVDGPTLATVLAARGELDGGELAGLLAGLGSALGHLHERGVVHGDVSPANIIVTPEGGVVLVDLAGQASHELGTPGFVPPECTRGGAAGAAGDVWALARVLEWAAGDVATGAETADDGAAVPGSLPRGLASVLGPALDPEPERRPGARDLASGAPVLGAAAPVRVPPPHALAQARMRDAGAPTQKRLDRRRTAAVNTSAPRPAPTVPGSPRPPARREVSPTRHRRGEAAARLTRWASAWSVTTGALLVAAVLLLVLPRVEEAPVPIPAVSEVVAAHPRADQVTPAPAPSPDVAAEVGAAPQSGPGLAAVAALLGRRDSALAARDHRALAATSVPSSPVAAADAQLLAGLAAADTVVEGLQIDATDLHTVAASERSAVVEVLLSQSAHERVSGQERVSVGALPTGCARLELVLATGAEWLLATSEPCP